MRGPAIYPRQFPINSPLRQWPAVGAERRSASCTGMAHNLRWRRATLRAALWSFRCIYRPAFAWNTCDFRGRHDVTIEIELFRVKSQCQPDQLRQMQDWDVQLLS